MSGTAAVQDGSREYSQSSTRQDWSAKDEVEIGTFNLAIRDLPDRDAEKLATEFREVVRQEFVKKHPFISMFYELEITEEDVWAASRHSRNRVKLKRKKHDSGLRGRLAKIGSGMMLAFTLLSTDTDVLKKNIDAILHGAANLFNSRGNNLQVEQIDFSSPDIAPPPPSVDTRPPNDQRNHKV